MEMEKYSLIFLFLSLSWSTSQAYFITVDAHAEECFFDKVKMGTKMGLMFEVAEGGFLDIDVRIEGPDGKIVHSGQSSIDMATPSDLCC